ncbi:MAG TPA: SIS domain-containing protein [Anaerolineaceae bacterium]|nr:SIS domain-containing protein [Anaerolineaceae bacterium]
MTLLEELYQQPQALRDLIQHQDRDGFSLFDQLGPKPILPVFSGMGASFHAAWIAALHLRSLGQLALSIEAADLFYQGSRFLDAARGTLIYVSQSGESGEAPEVLRGLPEGVDLIAVTNNPGSNLARAARLVFPLYAGEETLIASKTYLNSLAWLWLIARRWGGAWIGQELQMLDRVAVQVEALLNRGPALIDPLLEDLDLDRGIAFLGHGPYAATAREAAMTLAEWTKLPALSYSAAAFRHGFIETVQPGISVVIFTAPGPGHASALDLAAELDGYGALVHIIQQGSVFRLPGGTQPEEPVDEFLSPILDILPIQLLAQRLADDRGIQPGFRFIRKVVRKI